jgi:HPt (histidine-containing phosphotransfer) domain-containing protein
MFVDKEIWMEYLAGSEELFKVVGQSFLVDYKNYVDEMNKNIQDDKIDDVHNQLHSLKGITLNLGMKQLYDQTEQALIPIRKGIIDMKQISKLYEIFEESYKELEGFLA